jgi:hypothetical protein
MSIIILITLTQGVNRNILVFHLQGLQLAICHENQLLSYCIIDNNVWKIFYYQKYKIILTIYICNIYSLAHIRDIIAGITIAFTPMLQ